MPICIAFLSAGAGSYREGCAHPVILCRLSPAGKQLSAAGNAVSGPVAKPGSLERRPAEIISLKISDAFFAQQRRFLGGLDAFCDRAQAEFARQAEQMAQDDPAL